ncbi:NADPH-dependent pterin aldehyde reductase [Zea mays]|uniref:NADPH-dependent pterin aldehyde reductase n=1 Tax=Zea mays TaxID=4577 RepID=A0A3L6G975_MAIZE|nr:NADPH-dependent pterin aldehyde reductase [Zea mays]
MEVTLEAICSFLDARTIELETNAYPALDELTSKRSDSSVAELAKTVVEKKQVPDIIVNNAGTINKNNKTWNVSAEDFDMVVDTNIKGTANVLRHFVPLMIEKRHGIIINLSSAWGRSVAAEVAPYCASKWAIEGLTRSLAKELPPGLAAIALSPGVVNTDMLNSCFGSSAALYQTTETWKLKNPDISESEWSVQAVAASIYSTCNMAMRTENVSCF